MELRGGEPEDGAAGASDAGGADDGAGAGDDVRACERKLFCSHCMG